MTAAPDHENHPQSPSRPRRLVRAGFATAAILVITAAAAGTASAQDVPPFAAPADATVTPGVMTRTDGAQCTANFVYGDGSDIYIGQAAHCAGTGGPNEVNGCKASSLPLGTPVEVEGADHPGELAYSSWLSMQEKGETDPNACQYNDLALVKLDPADVAKTNPTMPFYGGPTGVAESAAKQGDLVFGYGNSSLRQGIKALRPKTGTAVGNDGDGWTSTVSTVLPGIPGDSGSGYLTSHGAALGVLSTLNLIPAAGTNGVSTLAKMLEYANGPGGFDGALHLIPGEKDFNPKLVPVDLQG